jgi:hypothetical protein
VATLVILAGCGALKPARGTPITDISLIAGDWAGTITEPYEPFYLKITPDRKLVAAWGVNYAWGTVTLRNGQATYEMQPNLLEGTIRLYLVRAVGSPWSVAPSGLGTQYAIEPTRPLHAARWQARVLHSVAAHSVAPWPRTSLASLETPLLRAGDLHVASEANATYARVPNPG